MPVSNVRELHVYISPASLTAEFSCTFLYRHDEWLDLRQVRCASTLLILILILILTLTSASGRGLHCTALASVQRYECLVNKCERALSSANVLAAQESYTECRDLVGELIKYPPLPPPSASATSASGTPSSPSARNYSNAPQAIAAELAWPHLAPAAIHLSEPTHAQRVLMTRLRAQFPQLDDSINIRIYDNVEQSGDPVELVERLKEHTYGHREFEMPEELGNELCALRTGMSS